MIRRASAAALAASAKLCSVIIRRIEQADADALRAVTALHAKTTRSALAYRLHQQHGHAGGRWWEAWIADELTEAEGFVALEGRFLVAALPYHLNSAAATATLGTLAMDTHAATPDYATSLLRHTLNWLRVVGMNSVTVRCFEDDLNADRLTAFGFAVEAATRVFSHDAVEPTLTTETLTVTVREARMSELKRLAALGLCDGQVRAYWLAVQGDEPLCLCRAELDQPTSLGRLTQLCARAEAPVEAMLSLVAQVTQALFGRGARLCLGECAATDNVARLALARAGFTEQGVELQWRLTL